MGCSLSKDAELEKYKKKVKQLENQLKASGRFAARTAFDVPYPWEERSKVNAVKKDEVSFKSVYSGLKGSDGLFDAHLHYLNYNQETEGMNDLVAAMDKAGVTKAALSGCPFKKAWVDATQERPTHPIFDDGDLYSYSLTDHIVADDIYAWNVANGGADSRFVLTVCGFNMGDMSSGDECARLLQLVHNDLVPVRGVGHVMLRCEDYTNVALKGARWTEASPAANQLLDVCVSRADLSVHKGQQKPRPMPFIFTSHACSMTSKPYRENKYEYLDEVGALCKGHPSVPCLWVGCGSFDRGQWGGYIEEVEQLLEAHPNLYISFDPNMISQKIKALSRDDMYALAAKFSRRVLLGSRVRGVFKAVPPKEFGDIGFIEGSQMMLDFASELEKRYGKQIAARVRYHNAAALYGFQPPEPMDVTEEKVINERATAIASRTSISVSAMRFDQSLSGRKKSVLFQQQMSYGGGGGGMVSLESMNENRRKSILEADDKAERRASLSKLPIELALAKIAEEHTSTTSSALSPDSHSSPVGIDVDTLDLLSKDKDTSKKERQEWVTIDAHLHLLDFLQKSSGTLAALKAMDGCKVERSLLFGMPCCKKWCQHNKVQPLYYQDDDGPCYVYSYADQMVADAWLALPDDARWRMAPTISAFDPTDQSAVNHVRRMYDKYPGMWRAVGEVMCRHDDLTTMLLDKEVPRVNHPALDPIFEFCVEKGLPICVHHNADRVGSSDDKFYYVHELEQVLDKHPALKFTWVHCGVSRRITKPQHHSMIDRMLKTYPNLMVDISWVIWEDVITRPDGTIKDEWVEMIENNSYQVTIGSDNVAQYFAVPYSETNLLSMNIEKYWPLFDRLSPEAAKRVAYGNAFDRYFKGWDVPKAEFCEECDTEKGEVMFQPRGSGGGAGEEASSGPNGTARKLFSSLLSLGQEKQVGASRSSRYAMAAPFYRSECLDPLEGEFVGGEEVLESDEFDETKYHSIGKW